MSYYSGILKPCSSGQYQQEFTSCISDVFPINGSTLSNHLDWAVLINDLLAASLPVKWTCSKLISQKGIASPSLSLVLNLFIFHFSYSCDLSGKRNLSTTFASITINKQSPIITHLCLLLRKKKTEGPNFLGKSPSVMTFEASRRRRLDGFPSLAVSFCTTPCCADGLRFPFLHFKLQIGSHP